MAIPRYERQVQYQGLPADNSRAMASRELAQTFGSLADQLGNMAATSSAAQGQEEGNLAGAAGKPEKKSDLTAYGQAYNRAAMQSYRSGLDADMRKTLSDLAEENRNDSEAFTTKADAYLSGVIKDIDPAVEQEVRNDFALRTQSYRQNIADGERRRNQLQMAGQFEQDTRDLTDSIYRSARDGLSDIVAADKQKLLDRIAASTISDKNPEGIMTPEQSAKTIAGLDADIKSEYTFGEFMRTLQNDGIDTAKVYLGNFSKARTTDLGMNPDNRDALVNKMEAELRGAESVAASQSAVNKSLFGQRVQDEIAMHRDGVEPPNPLSLGDFVSTYGAEEGAFRFGELQSERQYGQMVKQAISASPDEQLAMLQQMKPEAGEGYQVKSQRYDQMRSAIAQVNAARQKDPGAYALRQPGIADLPPEQQAKASLAVQTRWGIAQPKPLPNDVASSMVHTFSTKPGPEAADSFMALQAQYGKAYPEVYSQLVAEGLPPAFVAIGAGMAPGPSALLAEVANIDINELKNNLPVGIAPKDIKQALVTSAEDFNRSLVGMPGSEKTYNSMLEAAERLAYRYARQSGQSATSASDQAWREVLGSRYVFEEKNGGVTRIPNHLPADDIADNMGEVLDRVSTDMLDKAIAQGPGYNPEQLTKMVKSRGYFVTSEDEEGVYLFMDGRPVPGRGGQLIKFTWKQMLDPGSVSALPTADAKLTTGAY